MNTVLNFIIDALPPKTIVRILVGLGAVLGTIAGAHVGIEEIKEDMETHGYFRKRTAYLAAGRALGGCILGGLMLPYPALRACQMIQDRNQKKLTPP